MPFAPGARNSRADLFSDKPPTPPPVGGWEGGFDSIMVIPHKGERRVVLGLKTEATSLHWKNFLGRIRRREKPVSDVEFGLKVQAALSMAMLSYLNQKVAKFDAVKQQIVL